MTATFLTFSAVSSLSRGPRYTTTNAQQIRSPLSTWPLADPVIGHFRYIPSTDAHETFPEWPKQYGDVMYLEVLGRPMIVLSIEQAASDLLEKRGVNYSDRPSFSIYAR